MNSERPTPDKLLKQILADERKSRRGALKIFFGAFAGVGKTYAMLSAAHEHKKAGADIVVGVVETHGRPDTQRLLDGLPFIPALEIEYRGVKVKEFNLDEALKRKPQLLLVDELAHTNAPGSRHPKRWNDIDELLDAGIDVYTTLNVQHIESLSDLVASTTGVVVKETVPDSVFDAADDIVLVDINVDELLKRLQEGNVYIADHARTHAADNFFKKGNLTSLREIALRRAAERIDAQRDEYDAIEGQRGRVPIADKIMVCIGPDRLSAKLVRTARRMAASFKGQWVAVYIENARHYRLNERGKKLLASTFRLVERMGGKVVVLQSDGDPVDELINYSCSHGITKIIIGRAIRSKFRVLVQGTLSDKLIRRSGYVDVYVVTDQPDAQYQSVFGNSVLQKFRPKLYAYACLAVLLATLLGIAAKSFISASDQALVYLTGVVFVAARYGMGPALLYSFLSATCLDFFFIQPVYSFSIYDRTYWTTLLVIVITGSVIADQASRLRLQTLLSRKREMNTQTLYAVTKEFSVIRGYRNLTSVAAKHITDALDAMVAIWVAHSDGTLHLSVGKLPQDDESKENAAVQWCYDNKKASGHDTNTMPTASGFYLPLLASDGATGVLGVVPKHSEQNISVEEKALLETIASLLAASLERAKAAELAERSLVEAETERLRNTLLSSVSHDLRTPLASITGASSTIAMDLEKLPPATIRDLAKSIQNEATRLSRVVTNLLAITTLESGRVHLNKQPYFVQELIGSARARAEATLGGHTIISQAPSDLPMVMVDGVLIEQLLQNLIENAAHHTPPDSTITISAMRKSEHILVSVIDNGPGIPEGLEDRIFDKFYTVARRDTHKGTGLGLAICASIVKAHGQRIWVENRAEGGAAFKFNLPIADAAKMEVPHEHD